jgi:hypothetical protein
MKSNCIDRRLARGRHRVERAFDLPRRGHNLRQLRGLSLETCVKNDGDFFCTDDSCTCTNK